jgi:hypothetical protein
VGLAKPRQYHLYGRDVAGKLDCNYNRGQNKLSVDISFAVKATRGPPMGADPQLDFSYGRRCHNNVPSKTVHHKPDMAAGQNISARRASTSCP